MTHRIRREDIKQVTSNKSYYRETFSSPTEFSRLIIDKNTPVPYLLLFCPKDIKSIVDSRFREYVRKHKLQHLKSRKPYPLIWPRTPYNKHTVFLNSRGLLSIDHIELLPYSGVDELVAVLNSTLFALFQEIYSRTNLGLGTLKIESMDVKTMPVIKQALIDPWRTELVTAFKNLSKGTTMSLLDEIGTNKYEIELDRIYEPRRKLDTIVMGKILELTEDEQLELYRAVTDLVKSRIEKAKSLGKKKKVKEGIDLDAVIKLILNKIGDQTMGKFYKDKILTSQALQTRKLPGTVKSLVLGKGLFGWTLNFGKKYIECRSEEEAKYLMIFAEVGLESVRVPKDDRILRKILPELEKTKSANEEAINYYLDSIMNTKLRERLRHLAWAEIMK